MDEYESLSHTTWDCKYHVVFIPKCRRKVLYWSCDDTWARFSGSLRYRRKSKIEEGHLMPDHVHMLLSIPPKYAVSQVVGRRVHQGQERDPYGAGLWRAQRNFIGQHFWARGYFVNTVGRDEDAIRAYIRNQEKEDQRLDQLNLWR